MGQDKRASALVGCAKEYRMKGASPHELAEHNATVATSYNRHMVRICFWCYNKCSYQSELGPRGGLWPVLRCVFRKEGLSPAVGIIRQWCTHLKG
jgi:hypothetical protein